MGHDTHVADDTLVARFLRAGGRRRSAGWVRFFVPLDGTAVALELKLEVSGQLSRLRISEQQAETLDATPRLKAALLAGADNCATMLNLLLEEFDMPWAALRCFRHRAGIAGAIIEAADARLAELRAAAPADADDGA